MANSKYSLLFQVLLGIVHLAQIFISILAVLAVAIFGIFILINLWLDPGVKDNSQALIDHFGDNTYMAFVAQGPKNEMDNIASDLTHRGFRYKTKKIGSMHVLVADFGVTLEQKEKHFVIDNKFFFFSFPGETW